MKRKRRTSIIYLVCLLAITAGAILFYFSGCVVIPENALVISSSADGELERTAGACGTGKNAVWPDSVLGIDPEGFSLLSWNSHKGTRRDWQKDFVDLSSRVDFILLQEAVLDDRVMEQLRQLSSQWLFALAFQSGGKDIGILSAARVPVQEYCALREPEPLILVPKIALATTYSLIGREDELLVVNVHMVNFTFGSEVVRHQIEAMQALIKRHRGPVIVGGDFNTWNEERTTLVSNAMSDLGLEAVGFSPDHRAVFFDRTVDGVYYRGLEVTDSFSYQVESSDHNPLEVHFRVKHQGPG